MSVLGVLGAIGTGLGIIGNGISIFGGNGKPVADMGTQLTNSAGTLSAIRGAEEQSALSREVYDYQKSLQERLFEREDNAVQRRALDLEKAGLSKTLAAGSAANAGQAVKVETPQSESALRGQALAQGVQNMLSIAQAKANIALTEANAKKAESEAKMNEFDRSWYESAGIPSGTHSGLAFLTNSVAGLFGISNEQASIVLRSALVKIAEKFGIDVDSLLNETKNGPPEIYKDVVIDLSNLPKVSEEESFHQGNYSFGFLNQEKSLADNLERKLEKSESFMSWLKRNLSEYRYLSGYRTLQQYGMFLRHKKDGTPFAGDGYGGGMLNIW